MSESESELIAKLSAYLTASRMNSYELSAIKKLVIKDVVLYADRKIKETNCCINEK